MKPKCPDFSEIYNAEVLESMIELGVDPSRDYRSRNDVVFDAMVVLCKKNKRLPKYEEIAVLTKLCRRDVVQAISKLFVMGKLHKISRGVYIPVVNKQ